MGLCSTFALDYRMTMRTVLRKVGNFVGLIVPDALVTEMGLAIGTTLDPAVENGKLVASPVRHPRDGWAEAARRIAACPTTEEERDWMAFGNEADTELKW